MAGDRISLTPKANMKRIITVILCTAIEICSSHSHMSAVQLFLESSVEIAPFREI